MSEAERKEQALEDHRKRLLSHKEIEAKVRTLREQAKTSRAEFDKTEDDLKSLQSVGQIIGEVLRQLDEERCKPALLPCLRSQTCDPSLLTNADAALVQSLSRLAAGPAM